MQARSAGEGFVNSRLFAILSRAGFVARGLIYGIIGVLALDLALGGGGKITNQQGALRTVEHHSFGHLLLTSWPSASEATRSGASPVPRSATVPRAPTEALTGSARSAAASRMP